MLPIADARLHHFLLPGPRLPSRSLYDQTCKWCAKSGDMNQKSQGSSAPIVVALTWTRAARGREHGRSSLPVASVDACRLSPLARGSIDGWRPKEDTSWKTSCPLSPHVIITMCSTVPPAFVPASSISPASCASDKLHGQCERALKPNIGIPYAERVENDEKLFWKWLRRTCVVAVSLRQHCARTRTWT